ncbi:MAG: iron ABC transporter permease [Spirochaetales bacterium]|nr:iron ABC transporter permease [Spirochaetales bacterium]
MNRFTLSLLPLLLIAWAAALFLGSIPLTLADIRLSDSPGSRLFFELRLPRLLGAAMAGAALAMAGAVTQGLFRNPLAAPSLIGMTSGATIGAVLYIVVLGTYLPGTIGLPVAAFSGSLCVAAFAYRIATSGGQTRTSILLLSGVALSALAMAVTGYLIFLAGDAQLRSITFWTLGSLGGVGYKEITLSAPPLVLGSLICLLVARPLNLILLGEREAYHAGIRVERIKWLIITAAALTTGGATALAGSIQFIGLVVPNIVRMITGSDHRTLIATSGIGGAILLPLADLVARTTVLPAELPLGVVTAGIGGPFFLYLLLRERSRLL